MKLNVFSWELIDRNLTRCQEEMQQLFDLERKWPRELTPECLPEWKHCLERKERILGNLENLLNDIPKEKNWPKKAVHQGADPLPGMKNMFRQLHDFLKVVQAINQKNTERLSAEMEACRDQLHKSRSGLELAKSLRGGSGPAPQRVNVTG